MTDDTFDKSMLDVLNATFPELEYPEWFSSRDLAWIVYESIFARRLKEALQAEPVELEFVRRAFSFLENLAGESGAVADLLTVAVLETIHSVFPHEVSLIPRARSFMGPKTLALSNKALQALGRDAQE